MFDNPIGEENAVKVIDFVLDVGGGDVRECFSDNFQFPISNFQLNQFLVFDCYLIGPVDEAPDLGDGETAFEPAVLFLFVDGAKHFLAGGDDFGVDEDLGSLFFLIEEDKETFVEADLSSGQTDALGIGSAFEDFCHLAHFFSGFLVPAAKRLSFVLQEWMGGSQDLHRVYFTIDL